MHRESSIKLDSTSPVLFLQTFLSLAENQISGPIPPEISNLSGLRHLNLSNNVFNGSFPDEISSGLLNLRVFYVYNNNLTRDLPVSVTNLTQLRHLFRNKLHGEILEFIGDLPELEVLQLWENNFTLKSDGERGENVNLGEEEEEEEEEIGSGSNLV